MYGSEEQLGTVSILSARTFGLSHPSPGEHWLISPNLTKKEKTLFLVAFFVIANTHNKTLGTICRSGMELKLSPYSCSSCQLIPRDVEGTPTAGVCTVLAWWSFLLGSSRLATVARLSAQPRGTKLLWSSFVAAFSLKGSFGDSDNSRIYSGLANITDQRQNHLTGLASWAKLSLWWWKWTCSPCEH